MNVPKIPSSPKLAQSSKAVATTIVAALGVGGLVYVEGREAIAEPTPVVVATPTASPVVTASPIVNAGGVKLGNFTYRVLGESGTTEFTVLVMNSDSTKSVMIPVTCTDKAGKSVYKTEMTGTAAAPSTNVSLVVTDDVETLGAVSCKPGMVESK